MIKNSQKVILLASLLVMICTMSIIAILGIVNSRSQNDTPAICTAIFIIIALSTISFVVSILETNPTITNDQEKPQ
jgi:ABC-type transport system involved in multi-copper enzyme maturation permease subunit